MAETKGDDKTKWPKNLFKRGDSWVLDFIYRGERYTEILGPVSRSVAKETRDKRRGEAAADKLDMGQKIEDLVFEKATEKYLLWYQANKKPNSYLRHFYSEKQLTAYFGGRKLSSISTFLVEKYKLQRKESGAKHATINRELMMLRNMFNKAIAWKNAKANPCKGVALFEEDNGRTRYLTEDEARRLLSHCAASLRLLVLAAMHTGLRASELKSLRWKNVNLTHGSITADSAYTKNGDARTIPLTPDLAVALRGEYEKRKPAGDDAVFLNSDGKAWKNWRTAYKTALRKAGISDFRFHDLRHNFGSYLGMNNTNQRP